MERTRFGYRLFRRLATMAMGPALRRDAWRWIRWLPPVVPGEDLLTAWSTCAWPEYQRWLDRDAVVTHAQWRRLRREALAWPEPPRISIVTPVHDTVPEQLIECVLSVRIQAYPFWQLCLVDDGSSRADTRRTLKRLVRQDPRIRLQVLPRSAGIVAATNRALDLADGDFVAFLDHDDRLAPDALYRVAQAIREDAACQILYSDRDMIGPDGRLFMHLLKPDWSPETLLSGNYIFHLMVYRRDLLHTLGGLRPGFDGSQDYDLVLRAAELAPRVRHIRRVLYHWRQHPGSVALAHDSKAYAYQAGMAALREALGRRGLEGEVSEIPRLWRGNYRVRLSRPDGGSLHLLRAPREGYAAALNAELARLPEGDLAVVLGPGLEPADGEAVAELASWLRIPDLALVTGAVVDPHDHFAHAGLVHRPSGVPLALYGGYPASEPGYMATTGILHNVSAPHPFCLALGVGTWRKLGGFDETFAGGHAALDLALRAQSQGLRAAYVPFARFVCADAESVAEPWMGSDRPLFQSRWGGWLERGDPCFHPGLALDRPDAGLAVP